KQEVIKSTFVENDAYNVVVVYFPSPGKYKAIRVSKSGKQVGRASQEYMSEDLPNPTQREMNTCRGHPQARRKKRCSRVSKTQRKRKSGFRVRKTGRASKSQKHVGGADKPDIKDMSQGVENPTQGNSGLRVGST
ncbi:hypothetical protein KI387_016021, partial [Taxus chinensis]